MGARPQRGQECPRSFMSAAVGVTFFWNIRVILDKLIFYTIGVNEVNALPVWVLRRDKSFLVTSRQHSRMQGIRIVHNKPQVIESGLMMLIRTFCRLHL